MHHISHQKLKTLRFFNTQTDVVLMKVKTLKKLTFHFSFQEASIILL